MYDQSSLLIVVVLFALLLLGVEVGYRIGRKFQDRYSKAARSQINSMRASMLGILALLLGFTFSQALQRFDARSEAVVNEANAIGTAYLRAQLVGPLVRERAKSLVRDYLDLRVREAAMTHDNPERDTLLVEAQQKRVELWGCAQQAAAEDGGSLTSLFIESINEVIESFGRRDAEIKRHVPEMVLLILFATFILAGVVVGFSSGADGDRPSLTSCVAMVIIVLIVFAIIDLDHPRRGMIEVPRQSLVDLETTIRADDNG